MTTLVEGANKIFVGYLKEKIDEMPIKPEVKNLATFILENTDAYAMFFVHYAAKHKGKIDPNELLKELLLEKGKSLASFGIKTIDSETVSNLWAIAELIHDLYQDSKYVKIPVPGLRLLVVAVCVEQDTFDFLNNSTWSQRWWYFHVLKGSSPRVLPPPVKSTLLKKFDENQGVRRLG